MKGAIEKESLSSVDPPFPYESNEAKLIGGESE